MRKAKASVTELSPRPRGREGKRAVDVGEVLGVAGLVEERRVVVLAAVRVDDEHDFVRDDDWGAEGARRLAGARLDVEVDVLLALEVDSERQQRLGERGDEALRREAGVELGRAEKVAEIASLGFRRRDAYLLQTAAQLQAIRLFAVPEERLERRRQGVELQPAEVFAESGVIGIAQAARFRLKDAPALLAEGVLGGGQLQAQAVDLVASLRVRLVGGQHRQGAIGDLLAVPGRRVGGLAGGEGFAERLGGVLQVAFGGEGAQRRPARVVGRSFVERGERRLREQGRRGAGRWGRWTGLP